jgi:hypothetical protein
MDSMTMPRRCLRWIFRIGIVSFLLLLCAPNPVSSQTADRGADKRCLNCHGQEHIATISREERETMGSADSGMPEKIRRPCLSTVSSRKDSMAMWPAWVSPGNRKPSSSRPSV